MRFYAQDHLVRVSLPLLSLALCVCQIQSAVRHPSTKYTLTAIGWGLITLLTFWGTYWKITPQGLLDSRLFVRRVIPYNIIQDVSPDDSPRGKRDNSRIRVSILLAKPLLARPDEYERFVCVGAAP
jgi:hypothetical protein